VLTRIPHLGHLDLETNSQTVLANAATHGTERAPGPALEGSGERRRMARPLIHDAPRPRPTAPTCMFSQNGRHRAQCAPPLTRCAQAGAPIKLVDVAVGAGSVGDDVFGLRSVDVYAQRTIRRKSSPAIGELTLVAVRIGALRQGDAEVSYTLVGKPFRQPPSARGARQSRTLPHVTRYFHSA
jgi:hypothetical protein